MTIRDVDCKDFDAERMADDFAKMHVDFFSFFAGGYVTTYPTKLEFQRISPYLGNRDLTAEIIAAAHKRGIKAVPMIDLGMLPENAYRAHPEWAVIDANGKPVLRADGLYASCIMAGYVQEYSKQMVAEILQKYDVDGMKFGGASYGFIHDPCYCEACKKAYTQASGGKSIPTKRDWNDPNWVEFIRWRTEQTSRVVQHLVDLVHSIKPGLPVVGNSTDFGDPSWTITSSLDIERLAQIQDAAQVEVQNRARNSQPDATAEWQYLRWPSETARHLTTVREKPIWIVTSYFYAWPWRRASVPVAEQKVYLAQMIANGASAMVNLSGGPPAVHEDKRGFAAMEQIYGFFSKHRNLYEADQSAAEVALVYDHDSLMFQGNDNADATIVQEFRGIEDALDRGHVPFDIISTRTLRPEFLRKYRALIVPNTAMLDRDAVASLSQYVKSGGGLVATHEAGRNLEDLLGIHLAGEPSPAIGQIRGYIQDYMKPIAADHPILQPLKDVGLIPLTGMFDPITVAAPAQALLARTAPFQVGPEGWAYPRNQDPNDPILVVNQAPQSGRTAYFATHIGRSFWQSRYPDLATLIRGAVAWTANHEPPLKVVGPPTLQTSLRKSASGDRFMVHCINLTGGERLFDELVPLHDIRISLRSSGPIPRAWRASDGTQLQVQQNGGAATVVLDTLNDYDVIVFDMTR